MSTTLAGLRRRGGPDLVPPAALGGKGFRAGFRPDVEGLRAVAILLVVGYHVGFGWVSGGFVGVDVFFVISGFLITSHLVREVAATGRLAIGRFYARRVMRLLPAATVVIGATLVGGWLWLPVTRLRGVSLDALAATGYLLNYRLALLGTDYRTATLSPSPLQHFWSLAVEEQFYLIWPLLLLISMVLAGQHRAGLGAVRGVGRRLVFTAVLVGLTGASLAWSIVETPASPVWAYFGAPTRIWELGAGSLLALAAPQLARLPGAVPVPLRWAGFAAIALAAHHYDEATAFPGYHALLPVLGAVAVIAAGCDDGNGPGRVLGVGWMQAIGARSYSWYLWHWPVLIIGPFALGREFGTGQKAVAVGVAYGFAALAYYFVERPLRDHPVLRSRPVLAGVTGAGLAALVIILALLLPLLPARTPLGRASVAEVTLAGHGSVRTLALAAKIKAATGVQNLPRNLTPALTEAEKDDPPIYADGCHLEFGDTTTPKRCERFGVASSKTVIALFGDSHAAQWFPALSSIAHQRRWRLAVFTKGACNAASVKIYLPALKRAYDECVTWRARTLARIAVLHPVVVVTSSNADGGDALGVPGSQDDVWSRAWTTTIQGLTRAGTRVVYVNDTPWPKENVPDCLAQHPNSVPTCAQATKYAASSARRSMMAKAAAKAGASVVDPLPWFCSLKSCPVVVGNILVYKDDSHISTPYARLLAPLLGESVKPPDPRPGS